MPELVCTADDRDTWLAARQSGVTATDITVILGLSSYNSPYSLFWQKMGHIPPQPDSDRLRIGRELEPIVLDRWRKVSEHDTALRNRNTLFRSLAYPWQLATIDAETATGPVEVKTWADADRDSWGPSGPYSGPPAVRAQVLWQMDVMDAAEGHVGVLFLPSGEFRHYAIDHGDCDGAAHGCGICRDRDRMRAAGEEFMARLRMELPPPDPDSSSATLTAVRARFTKAKGKRGQVNAKLWEDWTTWRGAVEHGQSMVRGLESQIREQLGEADEIEVDGQLVGRRVVFDQPKPAYTLHKDYIRRVGGKAGNDAD